MMPSSLLVAVAAATALTLVAPAQAAPTMTNVTRELVAPDNDPFAEVSADGRFVAFEALSGTECRSTLSGVTPPAKECVNQVYVRDLKTGRSELVSRTPSGAPGNATSRRPTISADGRYVAFISSATNLAPPAKGTDTPIFVHDRKTRKSTRVRLAKGARLDEARFYAPRISPDGSVVVFDPQVDLKTGKTLFGEGGPLYATWWRTGRYAPVTVGADGRLGTGKTGGNLSRDGRYAVFSTSKPLSPADTDTTDDVYVRDLVARKTIPVTATIPMACSAADTALGRCSVGYVKERIDSAGRMVGFVAAGAPQGTSTSTYRVGVRDLKTGQTRFKAADEFITVNVPQSGAPNIHDAWLSGDGKHFYFAVGSDTGTHGFSHSIWHWDLVKNTTVRLAGGSVSGSKAGNMLYKRPSSSHDGKRVGFISNAQLTGDDTDDFDDVYVLAG